MKIEVIIKQTKKNKHTKLRDYISSLKAKVNTKKSEIKELEKEIKELTLRINPPKYSNLNKEITTQTLTKDTKEIFSTRTYNIITEIFKHNQLATLEDLFNHRDGELLRHNNLGRKSLNEIRELENYLKQKHEG